MKTILTQTALLAAVLPLAQGCPNARSAPPTTKTIHLEAENGELVGTAILTDGAGFSGTGYVGKLLALTEFGGVPDVERMRKFGVRWAYFASWGDKLGPKKVSPEELKRLYSEKTVTNKDGIAGFFAR